MSYNCTTLASGLRVASEFLPSMNSASVSVSVDVGARYEDKSENGLSHFLEHMAFKGTTRRNAKQLAESFDDIGGTGNAYTASEQTVYYAKGLSADLPLVVDILGDILCNSLFDEQELERERGVILQEIAMHHDSPEDLIFDYFQATAYPDQPLGRSILGTIENIEGFSRSDVQNYMAKHYHPKRMVVSAAGAVEHEEFVELVGNAFSFPADAALGLGGIATNAAYSGGDCRIAHDLEQLHVALGMPAPAIYDPEYHAFQLFSTILGGGMSSRLFQEVREKRGLAYHVSSNLSAYRDVGLFAIYAATGEEHAAELIPVICEQVQKLALDAREEELLRAKKQYKAGLLMARENSASVSEWIGRHLLVYNRYRTCEELIAEIEAVTLSEITAQAEKIAKTSALTFTCLGNGGGLESFAAMQARFG